MKQITKSNENVCKLSRKNELIIFVRQYDNKFKSFNLRVIDERILCIKIFIFYIILIIYF